jgi:hypothetical protein
MKKVTMIGTALLTALFISTPSMRAQEAIGDAGSTEYSPIDVEIPIPEGYNPTNTLRFLTYNLGADSRIAGSNATPAQIAKKQMSHSGDGDITDMAVFGGLYQWGRKDTEHSRRWINPEAIPDRFTTTQYESTEAAAVDGKFVWGNNEGGDWIALSLPNSNLWGNGLYIGHGGNGKDKFNKTYALITQATNNPCPSGYRVPTQHEWALLGHESGQYDSHLDDWFYTDESTNSTVEEGFFGAVPAGNPNVVWVPVSEGYASNSWIDDGKVRGYALYKSSVWAAAADGYKKGLELLTSAAAPEPLLFLPASGYRFHNDGRVHNTGDSGSYWSSVVDVEGSHSLYFDGSNVDSDHSSTRSDGLSVRCIAE